MTYHSIGIVIARLERTILERRNLLMSRLILYGLIQCMWHGMYFNRVYDAIFVNVCAT